MQSKGAAGIGLIAVGVLVVYVAATGRLDAVWSAVKGGAAPVTPAPTENVGGGGSSGYYYAGSNGMLYAGGAAL